MSIPKKGSRRIVVDGAEYWWRIRKKGTYNQTDYGNGTLNVAVAAPGVKGTVLVIYTGKPHPHDWGTATPVPVTPGEVAEWIKMALEQGWAPLEQGKQFTLNVASD